MLNNIKERAIISLFYKLLECLHHLNLMQTQLDGNVTKAFAQKLAHLNDFIKPAYAGPKISFHIDQINKMWLRNITNILVSHYNFSISELIKQIGCLCLNYNQKQSTMSTTIQRATKRFGKKLSLSTIKKFRSIFTNTCHVNILKHSFINNNNQTQTQNKHKTTDNVHRRYSNKASSVSGVRLVKGARDPLSNFFPCKFNFMGQSFPSVEHAYQYEKAKFSGLERLTEQIKNCSSAAEAKRLGREVPRSTSWESSNVYLMNQFLKLKWEQVPRFREELAAAKGKDFVHPVTDVFWGTGTKDRKGRDMFGTLLQNLLKDRPRVSSKPQKLNTEMTPPVHTQNRFDVLVDNRPTTIHTETPIRKVKTSKSPQRLNILQTVPGTPSPWKNQAPTISAVSTLEFPPLRKDSPKPQRTKQFRSNLNLRKRGPPSPSSPVEETSPTCPPPRKRKNTTRGGKKTASFATVLQTHGTSDGQKKFDWKWPEMKQDILVIGTGNFAAISTSSTKMFNSRNTPVPDFSISQIC